MAILDELPAYMLRFGAVWVHNKTKVHVTIVGLTSAPDPEKAAKYPRTVIYRYPDGRVWPREAEDFLQAYAFLSGESPDPRGYEVSDGHATVHLGYSEDSARDWVFGAKNEHRNRQMPSPSYRVHALYRMADLWGEPD